MLRISDPKEIWCNGFVKPLYPCELRFREVLVTSMCHYFASLVLDVVFVQKKQARSRIPR